MPSATRRKTFWLITLTVSLFAIASVFLSGKPVWPPTLFASEHSARNTAQVLFDESMFAQAEHTLVPFIVKLHSFETERLYGKILLARGEFLKARDTFSTVLERDSAYRELAQLHLATVQYFLGNMDSAEALAQTLLVHATSSFDTLLTARLYHLLGRIAFNRAQYDVALRYQTMSRDFAQRAGSHKDLADALRQLGVLAWYKGNTDSALSAFYEPALLFYRQLNDKSGEATTLSNIGLIHQQRGEWEKNLHFQLTAYDIRKRIGDQMGLCDSYYFMTHFPLMGSEHTALRLDYMKRSLALSTRIGYAWGREIVLRQLSDVFSARLWIDNRFEAWEDSLFSTMSGEGALLAMQRKGWRLIERGNVTDAELYLRRAVRIADSLSYHSVLASVLMEHGSVLGSIGKYREAVAALLRAQALAGKNQQQLLPAIRIDLALMYEHMGNYSKAKFLLTSVIQSLDSTYVTKISSTTNDLGFHSALGSVHRERAKAYERMVNLLSRRFRVPKTRTGREDDEAFQYIERERLLPFWGERPATAHTNDNLARGASAEFVLQLKQYESEQPSTDRFHSLLASVNRLHQSVRVEQKIVNETSRRTANAQPVSLRQLQGSLLPHEVVLEFFLTRTHVLVVVVRSGRSSVVSLPVTEEHLTELINVYRGTILRGKQSVQDSLWKGPARQLYALLIAPLKERALLQQGDALIVSPHRALNAVSFHALISTEKSQPPRFLIEDHAITNTHSATQWAERKGSRPKLTTLVAIAPDTRSLPSALTEIQQVVSHATGATTILHGPNATKGNVLHEARRNDILHIAAHARFNWSSPLYSTIQCADQNLELHEVLNTPMNASLVVLSACESGISSGAAGSVPTGDDFVSFPRAFLTAGAANVVASLWLVPDESTATLMQDFYRNLPLSLDSTRPVSEALTLAQRQYIERARRNGQTLHPFVWAGFYLTGAN